MVKQIYVPEPVASSSSSVAVKAEPDDGRETPPHVHGGPPPLGGAAAPPAAHPPPAAAPATTTSVAPPPAAPPVTAGPTIDFAPVYSTLHSYQHAHGTLSIPTSHPSLATIIDALSHSSEGIETLSKQRWEAQYAALVRFQEGTGHVDVPAEHPTLGTWVGRQREQFELYGRGLPCSLTRKRFGRLRALGFGDERSNDGERRREASHGNVASNAAAAEANAAGPSATEAPAQNDREEPTAKRKEEELPPKGEPIHSKDAFGKMRDRALKPKEEAPPAAAATTNDATTTVTARDGRRWQRLRGKCDVCEKRDGFKDHNLQRCRTCGVLVHELCYGMLETGEKDVEFVCHACQAVGTEVEVNVPSLIGGCGKRLGEKRERIKQGERPTECVLCSHDTGIHAMHPLWDTDGPEGRQLVVDRPRRSGKGRGSKREKRLAWVHTLCASVISDNPRTDGNMYGVDKDGNCDEDVGNGIDGAEFVNGDVEGTGNAKTGESKSNSPGADEEDSDDEDDGCSAMVAFVFNPDASKNIRDHRQLECCVCGKEDTKWRFPLQCIAGDDEELGRWKGRHPEGTDPCAESMHVGCARWGCTDPEGSHLQMIEGKRCRMCYFTPGRYVDDDEDSKDSHGDDRYGVVAHCYCRKHAKEIVVNHPDRKGKLKGAKGNGKAKQPRGNSDTASKGSRAQPKKKAAGQQARSSFKKSVNTLRRKDAKKKKKMNTLKRRSRATKRAAEKAIEAESKRARVGFAAEDSVQYPVRGKSASVLAGPVNPQRQPPRQSSPNGVPSASGAVGGTDTLRRMSSNGSVQGQGRGGPGPPAGGVVGGILRRMSSNGSVPGTGDGRPGPVPDLPTSDTNGFAQREGQGSSGVSNGTSGQATGKRKAGAEPDLPVSGSFKRIKREG